MQPWSDVIVNVCQDSAGRERPIRVLVVDDHTLVREGICNVLRRHGLEVVGEAGDGEAAVALTVKLTPDVVLMDIAMPGVNGIEATRLIRQRCPQAAVLMLTMYDDETYLFAALEAGAAGYVLKNARGIELAAAVRAVGAGESVLSPEAAHRLLAKFVAARRQDDVKPMLALTERELGILRLAAKGLQNKAIAQQVSISPRTVQQHLARIFDKLGVASRTEAVVIGLKRGWLRLEEID